MRDERRPNKYEGDWGLDMRILRGKGQNESASNKEKVELFSREGDLKRANAWRFNALLSLIGYAQTGLYPHLNDDGQLVEKTISEYIAQLRNP